MSGREIDEEMVGRWFTLIADRLGRPLDRVTVQRYLRNFDEAGITNRGLDASLHHFFDTAKFWTEVTPIDVVLRAKNEEVRLSRTETPPPRLDFRDRGREAADQSLQTRQQEAHEWAEAHPAEAKRAATMVAREYRERYKVKRVNQLSPLIFEMYKFAVVLAILRRARWLEQITKTGFSEAEASGMIDEMEARLEKPTEEAHATARRLEKLNGRKKGK